MEDGKIVLLRLFGNEMILGKKRDDDGSGKVVLDEPRLLVLAPTMSGNIRAVITSVCELFKVKRLEEMIEIPKSQVMYELTAEEIGDDIVSGYKSEISGIKIASAAETASINASKPDEPFII